MGYDSVRLADIKKKLQKGVSLKDALLFWNYGITVPIAVAKDELADILESSWSADFRKRYRVVCECAYCSPQTADRYSVCMEGYYADGPIRAYRVD